MRKNQIEPNNLTQPVKVHSELHMFRMNMNHKKITPGSNYWNIKVTENQMSIRLD